VEKLVFNFDPENAPYNGIHKEKWGSYGFFPKIISLESQQKYSLQFAFTHKKANTFPCIEKSGAQLTNKGVK